METTFSEKKVPGKNYVAFFDLDRTIAGSISGKSLAVAAYRHGHLSVRNIAYGVFLSLIYRLQILDPYKVVKDMIGWVKGIPANTMDDLCAEVLDKVLLPSVYKEALAEIEFHKKQNAKIVILSSSLKPICWGIARNLGIDDVICSDLEITNGLLTGLPVGRICFSDEKAIRLMAYCEANGFTPASAWYYGDSISDLPALLKVGHPVCINPDYKLKRSAKRLKWKTHSWGN